LANFNQLIQEKKELAGNVLYMQPIGKFWGWNFGLCSSSGANRVDPHLKQAENLSWQKFLMPILH
jgi:hypothetical protein